MATWASATGQLATIGVKPGRRRHRYYIGSLTATAGPLQAGPSSRYGVGPSDGSEGSLELDG